MPEGDHGTPSGVALHRARGEALCPRCQVYLGNLRNEGTPPPVDRLFDVVLEFPGPTYWRLGALAEAQQTRIEEFCANIVASTLDLTRGPENRLPPMLVAKIRGLLVGGRNDSEIARELGVSRRTVIAYRERWGFESNYKIATRRKA